MKEIYKENIGRGSTQTALYRKNLEEYLINPKLCKSCKKPLSYLKRKNLFCNHSCAASFNNVGVIRNKIKHNEHPCLSCGKLTKNNKYCCIKCPSDHKKEKVFAEIEKNGILHTNRDGNISNYSREYLLNTRGHKCQDCLNDTWKEKPITIEIHHVDGNPDNNDLLNIQLLCPNCHSCTNTSKSKNKKGNGRWSKRNIIRRERYNNGLSS